MRKAVVGMAVVVMACMGVARADIITIQRGTYGTVRDNAMRQVSPDNNEGATDMERQYPDVGYPVSQGQRHSQYWFDLSSIPTGSTINSATFGVYFNRSGSAAPAITGYKLSEFNAGKGWIEGTGDNTAAALGEPTWNSQKHSANPAWATAGATGDSDVDKATTITFNKVAATSEWKTFDVKTWVNGWVNNGVQNNGMLMWGGTASGTPTAYWNVLLSEYATTTSRPYLTVDYTVPEPVTGLLLAAGLALMLRRRR
jgi:hypothetical protein